MFDRRCRIGQRRSLGGGLPHPARSDQALVLLVLTWEEVPASAGIFDQIVRPQDVPPGQDIAVLAIPRMESVAIESVLTSEPRVNAVLAKQLARMHPTPAPSWESYIFPDTVEPGDASVVLRQDQFLDLTHHHQRPRPGGFLFHSFSRAADHAFGHRSLRLPGRAGPRLRCDGPTDGGISAGRNVQPQDQ